MTRIEIDIDGNMDKGNGLIYNGKFAVRLVREFGEGATSPESDAGRIEGFVAKSLEKLLVEFLPSCNKIIEEASRTAITKATIERDG